MGCNILTSSSASAISHKPRPHNYPSLTSFPNQGVLNAMGSKIETKFRTF